jgi:hypothetical protein
MPYIDNENINICEQCHCEFESGNFHNVCNECAFNLDPELAEKQFSKSEY